MELTEPPFPKGSDTRQEIKKMNAVAQEAAPAAKPKAVKEVEKVQMSDGRTVDFAGKAKFYKDVLIGGKPIDEASAEEIASAQISDIAIRLDFRNGATRTYPLNP